MKIDAEKKSETLRLRLHGNERYFLSKIRSYDVVTDWGFLYRKIANHKCRLAYFVGWMTKYTFFFFTFNMNA